MKADTREDFEQAVAYYHLKDIALALPRFARCAEICPEDVPARIYLERCREYQSSQHHFGTGELDAPLLWKDEFKTGIERVDGAHQELLQRINQHAVKVRQNEPVNFDDLFAFLHRHCAALFPFEEAMMREQSYPFADSHTHEHQHFIANLSGLQSQICDGCLDQRYLAYRIELLLLDWFAAHATKADRHFARFMQNTPPRQTATIRSAK